MGFAEGCAEVEEEYLSEKGFASVVDPIRVIRFAEGLVVLGAQCEHGQQTAYGSNSRYT